MTGIFSGERLQHLRRIRPTRAFGLLLLLLLLLGASELLLRTPIRGLADNTDYWRVALPLGIQSPVPKDQAHIERWHPFAEEGRRLPPILVSVSLLVAPVRFAQAALGYHAFDLYLLGLTYWALFLLGVGIALRAGIPLGLLVPIVWHAVDTSMLIHFHTLYVEAPVWIGTLALCGLFYTAPDVTRWGVVRTASVVVIALFIGFAKHAYAIIPLCVALAAALTYEREGKGTLRRAAPRLAVLGLAAVLPLAWAAHPPKAYMYSMHVFNAINGVTKGLLVVSSDPAAAVARMGLPPATVQLRDKAAFDPEMQEPGMEEVVLALRHSSKLDLVREYLRDPRAIIRALAEFTRLLPGATRTPFGNFERGDGPPYGELHVAWEWSAWAGRLLTASGVVFWGVLCTAGTLLLASRNKRWWASCSARLAGARAMATFLFLLVILQIPLIVIGDGFFDFIRHVHQLMACFMVLSILLGYVGVTELLRVVRQKWGQPTKLLNSIAAEQ